MQAPPMATSSSSPTAPQQYTPHLLHRDAADLPRRSSTPRSTPHERTISDHALYLLLMVERPLYEDVSSSSSSDGSEPGSSSGEEEEEEEEDDSGSSSGGGGGGGGGKVVDKVAAAGKMNMKMQMKETDEAGVKSAGGAVMKPSLKRPLLGGGPDEDKDKAGKKGKKRKKVSWAKVVSVRHYPEDSYPDGRRFEGRHRGRGEGGEEAGGGSSREGG